MNSDGIMSKKPLSELSLEELWQLFPIFLVAPNKKWKQQFSNEEMALKKTLNQNSLVGIYHIGSTAIPNIYAKDIVDILATFVDANALKKAALLLQNNGWRVMSTSAKRISLNKGYTEDGFAKEVFHLHLRLTNDIDEIYFRDYLIAHSDVAKEYEKLKLDLWRRFEHDRDGYTNAKTAFITSVCAKAKGGL